jgi:hypothetical protein
MSIARPVNTPFTLVDDESARGKYNMSHDSNFDTFTLTPLSQGRKKHEQINKEVDDFIAEIGFTLRGTNKRKLASPEVIIDVPIISKVDPKDLEVLSVLSGFDFNPVGVPPNLSCGAQENDVVYHHQRLDVLVRYKDWTYKNNLITDFCIPPMGQELFTRKFENSTMIVSPLGMVGPPSASNVIFGVRPKVTNIENVCFSGKFLDGTVKHFMWTMEGIIEVDGTVEVGIYDIGVDGLFHLISGPRSEAPWYFFNQSWLKSRVDLEFDVNGCSYVSQVRPEVFLKYHRGHCYCGDNQEYVVVDLPQLCDSVIVRAQFYEELSSFVYLDVVSYRRRPDNQLRINMVMNSMLRVSGLVDYLIIPTGSQRILIQNPVQVKATDKLTIIERSRLINEFKAPLVRSKLNGTSRNAAVWEYCKTRSFYQRGDIDNYLRSGLQMFIGNNGYGDLIRKRNEIVLLRLRNYSILICGQPRLNITWILKYYSYENFRMYFPDFYLITGKNGYYRIFYAFVDNCLLSALGLV